MIVAWRKTLDGDFLAQTYYIFIVYILINMKIVESDSKHEIELPVVTADDIYTYYDPSTKTYKPAQHILDAGFMASPHNMIFFGLTGSGKTSAATGMLVNKSPKSRLYFGIFDKIYMCCSQESMNSIKGQPFKSIPPQQWYDSFSEAMIADVSARVSENAEKGEHSLLFIDDAVNRLKKLENPLANLMLTNRHKKLAVWILSQDFTQVPLSIRSNINIGIFFKQSNAKRIELLREEYLSMLSKDEYRKFEKYVYKKKGDALMINFRLPFRYHLIRDLKVKELFFEGLENEMMTPTQQSCGCDDPKGLTTNEPEPDQDTKKKE
jgi:hypothetical protein